MTRRRKSLKIMTIVPLNKCIVGKLIGAGLNGKTYFIYFLSATISPTATDERISKLIQN